MKDLSECSVLVVDDIEANLDILVDTLADDYEVAVATDGTSALETVRKDPPDLILLDIMMPGMDGYEVCRRLKAEEQTRDIPIIFVTAKDELEDEKRGLTLGAVDYLVKPISPPIVKARVRTHLLLKRQRDQLKESISIMQHEAEILRQKAELGIQAGSLAHDINNILSTAMYVDFIPDLVPDDLPERQEILECVGHTLDSIRLGTEVCQGYTSYLRDIGEQAKVQPVSPLLQPLDMYAKQYKGKLERDFSPDVPPIQCKGYQLKRVFINLFVNACQSMENQEEQIIATRLWDEDDRVFFSIKDNGPGIPVDVLPRIFEERFTTKPTGTGLGLYLVKQIIDAHKGRIEVTSKEKEGTVFTISFPAWKERNNE